MNQKIAEIADRIDHIYFEWTPTGKTARVTLWEDSACLWDESWLVKSPKSSLTAVDAASDVVCQVLRGIFGRAWWISHQVKHVSTSSTQFTNSYERICTRYSSEFAITAKAEEAGK